MKSNNMTIRTGVAISLLAVAATGAMGASHREAPAITLYSVVEKEVTSSAHD